MTNITLTPEYVKRTQQAINETQVLLERELKYSLDLQNTELVAFYYKHINKLTAAIEAGLLTN